MVIWEALVQLLADIWFAIFVGSESDSALARIGCGVLVIIILAIIIFMLISK